MFGDREAFLNKFKTCARARAFGEQKLGPKFFEKEHTKALFNKHSLMTIHNLYFYHCSNDIYKILKFRTPISLHSMFKLSNRTGKGTLLLTPPPSQSYCYRSGTIWNFVRGKLLLNEFTVAQSTFKLSIKKLIMDAQRQGDPVLWEKSINNLDNAGNAY